MNVVIGDLGCGGVDVAQWRAANTVTLYPGETQNWILARTLRDDPTPEEIKETLRAVFAKWFAGEHTDSFEIVSSSKSPIRLENTLQRRENIAMGPIPTLTPGPVVYLNIKFAYRGQLPSLPWPVRTAPPPLLPQLQTTAQCPIGADWMLVSAGKPLGEAPPKVTTLDKYKETASEVVDSVKAAAAAAAALQLATTAVTVGVATIALLWWMSRK